MSGTCTGTASSTVRDGPQTVRRQRSSTTPGCGAGSPAACPFSLAAGPSMATAPPPAVARLSPESPSKPLRAGPEFSFTAHIRAERRTVFSGILGIWLMALLNIRLMALAARTRMGGVQA